MTDIQPGQRFTLYNGSGTWGHFDCEVDSITDGVVIYSCVPRGGGQKSFERCTTADFQKLIDDGYVEMKE